MPSREVEWALTEVISKIKHFGNQWFWDFFHPKRNFLEFAREFLENVQAKLTKSF